MNVTPGTILRANKYGWPKGTKLEYRWFLNGNVFAGGWNETTKAWGPPARESKGDKYVVRVKGTLNGQASYRFSRTYVVTDDAGTVPAPAPAVPAAPAAPAAPASAALCPPGQACTVGKSTVNVTAGTILRANKYGWPSNADLRYRWYQNGRYVAGGSNDTHAAWGPKGTTWVVRVHDTKDPFPQLFKVSRTYIVN